MATKFKGKRRKSSKRKRKGLPIASNTELVIPIEAVTSDGVGKSIVKVDQCLGKVNLRLYRQSMVYDCAFRVIEPFTSDRKYEFFTLPNNWFVLGAIKHAWKTWRANIQEELTIAGGKASKVMAPWYDFRINEQDPDAVWDFMHPSVYDGDGYAGLTQGEFTDTTTIGSDGSTAYGFHLFGNVSSSFNIFTEYKEYLMATRPDAPTVTAAIGYGELRVGDEDRELLAESGDNPPYDYDWVNAAGVLLKKAMLIPDASHGGGSIQTPRFSAPLGLVFIVRSIADGTETDFSTTEPELALVASPGKYKGVKASPLVRWDLAGATARSLR